MSTTSQLVSLRDMRASFAAGLSSLYGREVPAYRTLVEVSEKVNSDFVAQNGAAAEELGSLSRVTAERHGAIRVGSPQEIGQVARIFAAVGMYPTGFYDLRDAKPSPIPVVSTAFRPLDKDELAFNPFRVFTSLLVTDDRRFFDADLQSQLETFLAKRSLFCEELLQLADSSVANSGLSAVESARFIELAVKAFELSSAPVNRAWYEALEDISAVAADIGGVSSTHINHLTPRVLDIDALYAAMQDHGIVMIDRIQGPPRWNGPDVLLRQTSFRALAEPRQFQEEDGSIRSSALRVRFGEVEARGVALTPAGRDLYDQLMAEVDHRSTSASDNAHADVAATVWQESMPSSHQQLAMEDLAYYTFSVNTQRPDDGQLRPGSLPELIQGGWLTPEPIVYEDFLPRSAAGIFSSNLVSAGSMDGSKSGSLKDAKWLEAALGTHLNDPYALYAAERQFSLETVAQELGLEATALVPGMLP